MRHSDRPILRPKEDLLGRAKFSLSLARAIDNLALARDGFVIAIMGEWGSGKSSVVEMITRFLTHLEMERAGKTHEQTLETLEPLAETYDKIRDKLAQSGLLNLDLNMSRFPVRRNLFRKWLDSDEQADAADRYWVLLQIVDQKRHTIQVRFSPWLIPSRSELASAFFSELARAEPPPIQWIPVVGSRSQEGV